MSLQSPPSSARDVQSPALACTSDASCLATQLRCMGGGEAELVEKQMWERFRATPNHRIRGDIAFLRALIRDAGAVLAASPVSGLTLRELVHTIHDPQAPAPAGRDQAEWRREADDFLLGLAIRYQSDTSAALRERLVYSRGADVPAPTVGGALRAWEAEGRARVCAMFDV